MPNGRLARGRAPGAVHPSPTVPGVVVPAPGPAPRRCRGRGGLLPATVTAGLLILAASAGCVSHPSPTAWPAPTPSAVGPAVPTPPETATTPTPANAAAAAGSNASGPTPAAALPDIPRIDATAPQSPEQPPDAPSTIRIDDLGLDMPVVPVGVASDGQIEVPPDALVAGWYRFGPGLGTPSGSIVVVAHAGSRITPRGPFFDLRDAAPGSLVELTAADGTVVRYAVESRDLLTKTTIDWNAYFDRTGAPRLVLVTCGGEWDAAAQSYRENVVVTAVPAA